MDFFAEVPRRSATQRHANRSVSTRDSLMSRWMSTPVGFERQVDKAVTQLFERFPTGF